MSELKMFRFTATNSVTGELVKFDGQGKNLEDAWKDATSNIIAPYRPTTNGGVGDNIPSPLAVMLPNGLWTTRSKREFEGEEKFSGPAPDPGPRPREPHEIALAPRPRRSQTAFATIPGEKERAER